MRGDISFDSDLGLVGTVANGEARQWKPPILRRVINLLPGWQESAAQMLATEQRDPEGTAKIRPDPHAEAHKLSEAMRNTCLPVLGTLDDLLGHSHLAADCTPLSAGEAMLNWMLFLIALVTVVLILTPRGNRGARALGQAHLRYTSGNPKWGPELQSISADDSTLDTRKDPNLEYQGHIYFFCSIAERDICSANLQVREFHSRGSTSISRAVEQRA